MSHNTLLQTEHTGGYSLLQSLPILRMCETLPPVLGHRDDFLYLSEDRRRSFLRNVGRPIHLQNTHRYVLEYHSILIHRREYTKYHIYHYPFLVDIYLMKMLWWSCVVSSLTTQYKTSCIRIDVCSMLVVRVAVCCYCVKLQKTNLTVPLLWLNSCGSIWTPSWVPNVLA